MRKNLIYNQNTKVIRVKKKFTKIFLQRQYKNIFYSTSLKRVKSNDRIFDAIQSLASGYTPINASA